MKKICLWFWLLTKRLYKHPTFPILLLLIPVLCLGYSTVASQDSGVVTVALASDSADQLTREVFAQLSESDLLRFLICESPEEARLLVRTGKADEAWIFPEDLDGHLAAFAENPRHTGFIQAIRRENSVLLGLAREKLSSAVFPTVAKQVYLLYLRSLPGTEALSDQALLDCYDRGVAMDSLFTFRDTPGGEAQDNYLLTPLRGLLGIVILLGGLAGAMYCARDVRRGTFCWVRFPWRFLPELASQVLCTLQLSLAAGLCLVLSGLSPGCLQELATALVYGLQAAVFGMLLRRITRKPTVLGIVLPVLLLATLVLCPVFFDLGSLRPAQYLLPPTYFINAAADPLWLSYAAIYTSICGALCCAAKEHL